MPIGKTFKGIDFFYHGSLDDGLEVYNLDFDEEPTGTKISIDLNTINIVKYIVNEKNRILMGACRDNPNPHSIGAILYNMRKSPQLLSYLLPILEEDGFLTHYKEGNAFIVQKNKI